MKKTFLNWIGSLKEPTKTVVEPTKTVVRQKPPCICQEIWKAQASGFCGGCNTTWL